MSEQTISIGAEDVECPSCGKGMCLTDWNTDGCLERGEDGDCEHCGARFIIDAVDWEPTVYVSVAVDDTLATLASLLGALSVCCYCRRHTAVAASRISNDAVCRLGTSGPTSYPHCDKPRCREAAIDDIICRFNAVARGEIEHRDMPSAPAIRQALVLLGRAE